MPHLPLLASRPLLLLLLRRPAFAARLPRNQAWGRARLAESRVRIGELQLPGAHGPPAFSPPVPTLPYAPTDYTNQPSTYALILHRTLTRPASTTMSPPSPPPPTSGAPATPATPAPIEVAQACGGGGDVSVQDIEDSGRHSACGHAAGSAGCIANQDAVSSKRTLGLSLVISGTRRD